MSGKTRSGTFLTWRRFGEWCRGQEVRNRKKKGRSAQLPGWRYPLLLFVGFVAGLVTLSALACASGKTTDGVAFNSAFTAMFEAGDIDTPLVLIIFMVSIPLTHAIVYGASRRVRGRLLQLEKEDKVSISDLLSPALVGICESIMYPIVLLFGWENFIGAWLAMKVAGEWIGRDTQSDVSDGQPDSSTAPGQNDKPLAQFPNRSRFNGFLVNNSLSLMCGAITYALLCWALGLKVRLVP